MLYLMWLASWVEEEHEIMSDKGLFKEFMSEKYIIQFSETEEGANTDCFNKYLYSKIHWVFSEQFKNLTY